jgi:hypothetical protein
MARLFYLRCPLRTIASAMLLFVLCVVARPASAQNPQPENKSADGIRGTVVNSVTHEPIGRALVYSPDNRFATMTDSEGHFEFTFAKSDNDNTNDRSGSANKLSYQRANIFGLVARKPGFIEGRIAQTLQSGSAGKDFVISLTPESLVIGRVLLSNAEASDPIQLELYRRQVLEGLAHWVLAGSTSTKSNGEFRFAELPAGSYKLLTRELMDRDPLASDPKEQVYGYPPVYFPNATDFAAGQTIQLASGQIFQADISLVRHAYYPVKVVLVHVPSAPGISIVVSVQGHRGPGYALGYNHREQMIEGLLPNGNYTLEASSFGPNGASGVLNISVKGAAVEGDRMTLVPNGSIGVNVKDEFTSTEDTNPPPMLVINGRRSDVQGPARYLNLHLEAVDDFGQERSAWMRPHSNEDDSLAIEGVQPGRYWVRTNSSRGFVASITAGTTDLRRQPLIVGLGGSSSPIEVTMRDAGADVDGTIDGVATSLNEGDGSAASPDNSPHVYFVPLADSSGEFRDVWVSGEGKFGPQQVPPGTYLALAFDRPQPELEYGNAEAMRAYEDKGQLIRLTAGQKDHLHLQLISTNEKP